MGVGYLTGQGGGGSNIKSIQRGEYTFPYNQNTANITVSGVDLTKSIIKLSYRVANNEMTARDIAIKGKLTTQTNIELKRGVASTTTTFNVYVYWEVIEFNNVKSLQEGDYQMVSSGSVETTTISPVNLDKSVIFFTFSGNSGPSISASMALKVWLSSNAQVSFHPSVYYGLIHWQVIEFK